MRWTKRGLILKPPAHAPWARTHAALPIVEPTTGSRVRIYFSARDGRSRAQIGRATVDFDDGSVGPEVEAEPIVRMGQPGTFDDSGVTGGCLVSNGNAQHLYYSGWSLAVEVPFLFFIGCAVSTDRGATFEKVSQSPVLGRSRVDPLLTASPSILVEGGTWRMWYVSGTGWGADSHREPSYLIRYAESNDGVEWRPTGRVCIDYSYPGEHAIARPHVVKDGATYRMWYSHRVRATGLATRSQRTDWRGRARTEKPASTSLATDGTRRWWRTHGWVTLGACVECFTTAMGMAGRASATLCWSGHKKDPGWSHRGYLWWVGSELTFGLALLNRHA